MEHYQRRPRFRDKHSLRRRDYFKHFRDIEPNFDLGDMGLDEIREDVQSGELRPFRDEQRRDELGEAIDSLGEQD